MGKLHKGSIELIYGPMFSGKTTELHRQLLEAHESGLGFQAFKSYLDDRYAKNYLVTHTGEKIPCTAIRNPNEILSLIYAKTTVFGVDEVHLFQNWYQLVLVANVIVSLGKRIIFAGLDTDYQRVPFEWKIHLQSHAKMIQLEAICQHCRNPARFTQRLSIQPQRILVGGPQEYEPRCSKCHKKRAKSDWRNLHLPPST